MVVAALYFLINMSRPLLFWLTFVLIRPLGSTLANSFDKPAASGGPGFSDITISAVLAIMMVIWRPRDPAVRRTPYRSAQNRLKLLNSEKSQTGIIA